MADERVQRRLAAILAADVVGYSRLVGMDEEGTIARLKRLRETLIDPSIARHQGRIVKTTGDGLLVEFASVVDAVRNAVEMQRALAAHEADVAEHHRMLFRMGINLGDIVIDGDDILGDGVNVAARLEALADPGGICVSGDVFRQVEGKLDPGYQSLGEQRVKNIEKPVRVYRVLLDAEAAGKVIEHPGERHWQPAMPKAAAIAVALAVLVAVGGGFAWWRAAAPETEPASIERMAFPLPEKPSIAVLPFTNISGDPGQDYFSDGITEDIITTLAKIPNLFVIARNSTFTYKGRPVEVREVAEKFGVRYVLEGSVQRSGDELRITAQLVDAVTGHHLWAERYDRGIEDLFALQDEITLNVVSALEVELTEGEQALVWRRGVSKPEAWELSAQAKDHYETFSKEGMAKAQQLWQQAVELDPDFVMGWVWLAWTHWMDARRGWSESRETSFARAVDLAQKALAMDDSFPSTYALLGGIHLYRGEHDEAIAMGERSIALSPNDSFNLAVLAHTLFYSEQPEEAIALTLKAMRLSPVYLDWYLLSLGHAYYLAGQHDKAIDPILKYVEKNPEHAFPHAMLAAIYAELDRRDDARTEVEALLERSPGYSLEQFAKGRFYKNPDDLARVLDALRKAGVPET